MQKNIYRVILTVSITIILVVTAVSTAAVYSIYQDLAEKELQAIADICASEWEISKDSSRIAKILSSVSEYNIRYTYIDNDGNVTYDTSGNVTENHLSRPEVAKALENGFGEDTRKSETIGTNCYYYAVRCDDGVLRLSIEYTGILKILAVLIPVALNAALIIAVIVGIVSLGLSKKLTRPIEELSRRISEVNMYSSRPVKIDTDCEEIKPIAENTEAMANEIANHLKEIERTSNIRREFTSNVSHELKTPLTTVRGFAEMIQNGMITEPAEIQNTARLIYNESGRLLEMINDIIELSRIEENTAKTMSEIRLDKVMEDAAELMSGKAVEHRVHIHIHTLPVTITANKGYMTELLINLIDNAIKYNKPDGNVWLSASISKNVLSLKVSDDGMGIAEDELDRVFERFYRVDKSRSTQGTGLGLSIVKHIAAYHDAKLEIYSALGEGTTVLYKMQV